MFGEFHGLPVHALVVHVVVVFAPVSALLAIAYLVPAWRRVLRWPLAATAVIAAVSAFVARKSGEHLKDSLGLHTKLIKEHEDSANKLFIALLVLAVLSLIVLALSRLDTSALAHAGAVLVALVAIVVAVLTYQTGEKGAKAVWNPAGNVDYSKS